MSSSFSVWRYLARTLVLGSLLGVALFVLYLLVPLIWHS